MPNRIDSKCFAFESPGSPRMISQNVEAVLFVLCVCVTNFWNVTVEMLDRLMFLRTSLSEDWTAEPTTQEPLNMSTISRTRSVWFLPAEALIRTGHLYLA